MPANSPSAGAPPPHGGGSVVTAGAPRGATEAVVLALHGRGATAQGVVNLLDPAYRHGVTFLAPNAYRSRWYPHAAAGPRDRNEPDISSAIAVVDALVDHATSTFGVDHEHVVLAGFSQGATVAAEYALANPRRYGGVALLSGVAIDAETAGETAGESGFAGTPVLLASGADDPHVPTDRVHATADVFTALGADVDVQITPGVGHEVTDDVLEHVGELVENARKVK
jgi:phospholipase/carboxylesterase